MLPTLFVLTVSLLGVSLDTSEGVDASVEAAYISLDARVDDGISADLSAAGIETGLELDGQGIALGGPGSGPAPESAGTGTDSGTPSDGFWAKAADVPPAKTVAVAAPTAVLAAAAAVWAGRATLWGRAAIRAVQIVGVALPFFWLFSRIDEGDLAKNPVRRAVLDYVRAHPGITIKEVQDTQEIAWGTAVYHLRRLERAGYLVSDRDGRLHRYWERNTPHARQRQALSLLMADTPRGLADMICGSPGIRQKNLCERLGISKPVASKYLARLEQEALIEARPVGTAKEYYPAPALAALPMAGA